MQEKLVDKFDIYNHLSHAYLFNTSSENQVLDIAINILSLEPKENIYDLLKQNVIENLIYIEADGQWIKKEQIYELKEKFKIKSSNNKKQIYIIKYAEDLNKNAANSLLKFLEEPEENIVAFLMTRNLNKVLKTIVSRCQYINLEEPKKNIMISDEIIEIFNKIESDQEMFLIKPITEYFNSTNRTEIKEKILELIYLYEKMLLNKYLKEQEELPGIKTNLSEEEIKKRMETLILIADRLEYNVNLKMITDKMVIGMFGVD